MQSRREPPRRGADFVVPVRPRPVAIVVHQEGAGATRGVVEEIEKRGAGGCRIATGRGRPAGAGGHWPFMIVDAHGSPAGLCRERAVRQPAPERCPAVSRARDARSRGIAHRFVVGTLSIEPTDDPCELVLRWFGTRHILHVPRTQPFTAHELRVARAIGEVLSARYQAIFDASVLARRADLFQGLIEDRYVAAFLDRRPYKAGVERNRADRLASCIEVLRVAALSSYESRAIFVRRACARR